MTAIISIIQNCENCLLVSVVMVLKQKPSMGIEPSGEQSSLPSPECLCDILWRLETWLLERHHSHAGAPTLLPELLVGTAFSCLSGKLSQPQPLGWSSCPILGGLRDLLSHPLRSCGGSVSWVGSLSWKSRYWIAGNLGLGSLGIQPCPLSHQMIAITF